MWFFTRLPRAISLTPVSWDTTPNEYGFMYVWSFGDIDGQQWEVMYMDPSAVQAEKN